MTTKVTMARPRFYGCLLVALLCLSQLAAAERALTFSVEDVGGSNTGLKSDAVHATPSETSRVAEAEQGASSSETLNPAGSWFTGAWVQFSNRVFRLAYGEPEWPTLKLTDVRTILGIVFGGIGAALSSAGGLGGGGLFVPLFNLLLQFDAKTSAALSNFMILGGSVVNLCINLQQHHPVYHDKPVIDFDVLLLMLPNMLLGISFGVILNVVMPAWVITASLALVLGYMTIHSLKGGIKRWQRESIQNAMAKKAVPDTPVSADPAEGNFSFNEAQIVSKDSLTSPLLQPEVSKGSRLPLDKILALLVVWLAFFSVQVFRGGKGGTSIIGIEKCGLGYWLISSVQIPLALIVTTWTVSKLRHGSQQSKIKNYDILEEGYALGPEAGTLFPWMALIAGVLGGMLGIGGGMIINPLLFTVGMLPQVTAATCASIVFFSSSMSVIQYWLMGRIPVQYAMISAVLCAVFSLFGIVIVHKAIERYNRASLIVFSVAAVMGVSAVLMCGFGGWDVYEQYKSGAYMGFHYPC